MMLILRYPPRVQSHLRRSLFLRHVLLYRTRGIHIHSMTMIEIHLGLSGISALGSGRAVWALFASVVATACRIRALLAGYVVDFLPFHASCFLVNAFDGRSELHTPPGHPDLSRLASTCTA